MLVCFIVFSLSLKMHFFVKGDINTSFDMVAYFEVFTQPFPFRCDLKMWVLPIMLEIGYEVFSRSKCQIRELPLKFKCWFLGF